VCHKFTPQEGDAFKGFVEGKFKASDLGDYGTAKWVRGLLNDPADPHYFGLTGLNGMKKWRKSVEKERKGMDAKALAEQDADFDLIAQFLADQAKPKDQRGTEVKGMEAFKRQDCVSCHSLGSEKDGQGAPDLNDYGSPEWIRSMVMSPASKLRFMTKNEMPAFRSKEGPGSDVSLREFHEANPDFPAAQVLHLSDVERELIVRFVTRDYRVVFGGTTIAGPPK
jgi:mono/diheme cytochrome c family protein